MAVIVKHTAFFKFIALEHMPKKCVILSQIFSIRFTVALFVIARNCKEL